VKPDGLLIFKTLQAVQLTDEPEGALNLSHNSIFNEQRSDNPERKILFSTAIYRNLVPVTAI